MIYDNQRFADKNNPSSDVPAGTKNSNQTIRCSLCGKTFDKSSSKNLPFCSHRCQQIDLGNWLNESYGLPIETGECDPNQDDLDSNE